MVSKINWTRVLMGGLLAGVVLNVVGGVIEVVRGFAGGLLLEDRVRTLLGHEMPAWGMPALGLGGMIIGIVAVWIYAAIRAHYGAGPRTALIAAVMVWLLGSALRNLSWSALGVFEPGLMAIASVIELVELILATLAGAWVYKPAEEVVAIEPGISA